MRVEEILTYKNQWQVDFGVSYSTVEKSSGDSQLVLIPVGDSQTVPVYSYLGEQKTNQDFIVYLLNIRYGLSDKLEIFCYTNSFSSFTRTYYSDGNTKNKEEHRFYSAGLGFSYQLLEEKKHPALIVSASSQVVSNTRFPDGYKMTYMKHHRVSITSYYTVDPLVFLIQTVYTLNLKEKKGNQTVDYGDRISFSPHMYFAVNPYTTLSWGVEWYLQGENRINGQKTSYTTTKVSYIFGASYEITNNWIANFDYIYRPLIAGSQSFIRLMFNYKF